MKINIMKGREPVFKCVPGKLKGGEGYTIFMPFSSDSHNSFLLPPMNLIYGSKDSSLQELYNEL